jgi:signal peptidase
MRHLARILRTALLSAAIAVVAVLAATTLVPAVAGYDRYVITSGSMTGTYDTGAIVYAKAVPTATLRAGDVITYAPPPGASATTLVTHRITSIRRGPKGERVFRTKGDANQSADPWRFVLPGATQARVETAVPYVGYAFLALGMRNLRMFVVGVPALLVALSVLLGIFREAREEARLEAGVRGMDPPLGAGSARP